MSSIFHPIALSRLAVIVALGVATATATFALAQTQLQTQMTPQMRSEAKSLMQACRTDFDKLCSNVTPGGGRVLACLQSHAGQLSSSCAQTLPRAQALRNSAGAAPK